LAARTAPVTIKRDRFIPALLGRVPPLDVQVLIKASLDNGSFFEFLIEIHSVIARVYYVIDPNLTAQEAAARNGLANDVVDLRIVRQKPHS